MPVIDTRKRPITRDLTQSFRKSRMEQRRKRQEAQPGQHPGSEPLIPHAAPSSDPESPSAREKTCLPPRWVDSADKAKEDIKDIRDQLAKLARAQQRRLLQGPGLIGDAPDQEVEAISAAIATQIRVCEQSIHQVRTVGQGAGGLLDDEFRQNTQRSLAAQLQQLSKQCRETRKEYMQEVKKRRQQQQQVLQQQQQQPGLDLEGGGGGGGGGGQALTQTQLLELENMEEFAAQRSSEVAQIASSIEELNRIFRELATMVIDQGSILDRIDYNTEKIHERSKAGRKQMSKAVDTRRKNNTRAWWCMVSWGAADAVAFLILLVKWHIKYGLKNVAIFLCVLAAIGAGVWFGWKHLQPLLCPRLTSLQNAFSEWTDKMWKKVRPGPVNAAKAAAAGAGGGGLGGGLNAMRHVWRPPGR